ncbi:NAD-dependent epimerase/dehydratase family protein [Phytohabitans sp. LJ34]|uniref:NAD-dependent epimerase/dehydratase family protein n=1 Tax=Phytohabitans sp. LJ34 TaxID=3452217 RepID=UPI003F899690
MSVVLVTGSGGLIGSEAARHFAGIGLDVLGIDNDMRARFYGGEASTANNVRRLMQDLGAAYHHEHMDIRDREGISRLFGRYRRDIVLVVHAAAQPSHDWAASDPFTDFDINATGTLNLLQNVREQCADAPFIHCSTNKVYGDRPNSLPFVELDTRWELEPSNPYYEGVTEDMPIDGCLHSIFGASKLAADIMVQEYGRYFGLKTACFRAGTLTGPAHAATELHGFLAYVMRCAMERRTYNLYGYHGKQVRDAIHAHDVVAAFEAFFRRPRSGEVYNLGGGRHANVSNLEAIALAEKISGNEMRVTYHEQNRIGDHIWWVSSMAKWRSHYPSWSPTYDVPATLVEIYEENMGNWKPTR